jgi:alpha-1,3-glucan synthase
MLNIKSMADLIGVDGYLNESAPFNPGEYDVVWKTDRNYSDFEFGNVRKDSCQYPRFWNESGERVLEEASQRPAQIDENFTRLVGCYDSEFDQVYQTVFTVKQRANYVQYGDTEAFGVFADWQRQLSKFASVQDRLREWVC